MRTLWLLTLGGMLAVCTSGCARKMGHRAQPAARAVQVQPVQAAAQMKAVVPDNAPAAKEIEPEQPPPRRGIRWTVAGWGENQTEAENHALEVASQKLSGFFQTLNPPLDVKLTPDYVRKNFKRGTPQRRPELEQEIAKVNAEIHKQCWSITVEVTPQGYADLVALERRAELRQVRSLREQVAATAVAFSLVVFLAVIGFLRLKGARSASLDVPPRPPYLHQQPPAKTKLLVVGGFAVALLAGLVLFYYLTSIQVGQIVLGKLVAGLAVTGIVGVALAVTGIVRHRKSRCSHMPVAYHPAHAGPVIVKTLSVGCFSVLVLFGLLVLLYLASAASVGETIVYGR